MILTASFTPLFSAESVFKGNAGTNSKNMRQAAGECAWQTFD